MNNDMVNKAFHQYTFPHSLVFLPCFLEQSVTSSHLYLYEPRHCVEKFQANKEVCEVFTIEELHKLTSPNCITCFV